MRGQQIEQLSPLQGIGGIAGGEQRGDVGGRALDVGDRRAGGDAGPGIGQLAADAVQLALQNPDGLLRSLNRLLGRAGLAASAAMGGVRGVPNRYDSLSEHNLVDDRCWRTSGDPA
jgi:hypothetical protein